jgi:hypothetical protein
VKIDTKNIDEIALLKQLTPDSERPKIAWTSDDGRFLVLEVRLENHRKLVDSIRNIDHAESITSSGKIRLVKSRMSELYKSP